ncbi:green-sensitive opsin-like [Mytilus trossulus]|uniref:green-sensitive opsin-like n=1 Tax=Mytilus trossulus TaxID=6551 RepID=UPI0030078A58
MNASSTETGIDFYKKVAAQTPAWFHYVTGIILLITNIGSVVTNGSVLIVLLVKSRKLLIRTNLYIAAICLKSFLMSAFGVPMVVVSCFNKWWFFGEAGCKFYAFLMSYGGLANMLLLCMISVERYIYVVRHGLSQHSSSTFSIVSITVSCAIAFGFAVGPIAGWNQYTYEGVGTSCAMDLIGEEYNGRSFMIALLVIFFVLPVIIMTFNYGSVYAKVIKESKPHLRSSNNQQLMKKIKKLTMEKELAITVVIIIGFFLLCYSPYAILLLWKLADKDSDIDPMLMAVPAMVTKIGGMLTPFVYLGRNKTIRSKVLDLYACCKLSYTVSPEIDDEEPPENQKLQSKSRKLKAIIKNLTSTEIKYKSEENTEGHLVSKVNPSGKCQSLASIQSNEALEVTSSNRHSEFNIKQYTTV